MNKTSKMIQFTLIIVFIDIGILVQVNGNHFTNKFAVHIHGGERVAREIAAAHGYVHLGQIGSLEDHYLFEHPHVHRRSAARSQVHHEKLSSHPQIHWFEQQRLVSRKKRDFQPIPADVLLSESLKESSSSRHPRDADTDLHFNDPLYNKMWYFNGGGLNHTDMNVKGAWKKGVTGKNVVITILDDGIEREHDDLKDNYDPYASYDVNNHDSDPTPRYDYTNENRHGTRCAGEVSAKANNSVCVVGVAYDSKIGGVRMLDGDVYDAVEATSLSHNRSHIDIYSASWGPDDDGRVVDGPGQLAKKAFIDGVNMGRNGKGSIFVWASGNGGNQKDSCNCDGYTNSIYTLSISSISQQGKRPWYLEECSSTLATTYSSGTYAEKQIVTVDLRNKCTETHTGTSASAPLAAGIVALILEVRPSLTWRDVQYITLMTARPLPDGVWTTNAVGRKVSLRYGYGLMDATAMVELAEKWTNVPAQHICTVQSGNVGNGKPKLEIPDSGYEEVLGTDACAGKDNAINFLEHVQAKITLKSKRRGDLVIHLTSPSGTRSTILPQRPNDSDRMKGFDNWAFLSVHFWGENPVGNWKLEIEIVKNPNAYAGSSYGAYQASNDLIDWSLILYGTDANPVNLVSPDRPSKTPPTAPSAAGCHVQCKDGCSGPHADQCNNCKNYIIKETRMCVEVCPNNYYAQDQECHPCSESCETCTSITEQQVMCLKCKPGYLLVEGKGTCEQQCDKGYYKSTTPPPTLVPLRERSDIECHYNVINVFIPASLIPDQRNVTWREEACAVLYNGTHYVDSLVLSECGTTIKIENDTVTFRNELIVHKSVTADSYYYADDDITYGAEYETVIPVECVYPRQNIVHTSYTPVKQSARFFEKRHGDLEVAMHQYENEAYEDAVPSPDGTPRKVPLNDDIFIRVGLNFEPEGIKVKAVQCIATATPAPTDKNWRLLIHEGCPEDNVRLISSPDNKDVRFTLKAFDFKHNASGFIFLHCQVNICESRDDTCSMGCPGRAKRSTSSDAGNSKLVSMGPFFVEKPSITKKGVVTMPTVFGAVCLLVAMVAVTLAVIGWSRRPIKQHHNTSIHL